MAMLAILINIFSCIAQIWSIHSQICIQYISICHKQQGNKSNTSKDRKSSSPRCLCRSCPFKAKSPPFIMKSSAEPNHKIFPVQCNGAVFHFRPTFVLNRAAFSFKSNLDPEIKFLHLISKRARLWARKTPLHQMNYHQFLEIKVPASSGVDIPARNDNS